MRLIHKCCFTAHYTASGFLHELEPISSIIRINIIIITTFLSVKQKCCVIRHCFGHIFRTLMLKLENIFHTLTSSS